MAFRDLREWIAALERAGELVRVSVPVSKDLEITEITDRVSKKLGPALLFENVMGFDVPVLINAFGSPRRMMLALGITDFDDWAARLDFFLEPKVPVGIFDKIKILPKLQELGSIFPKEVRGGPVKEVIAVGDEVDLGTIPVITCWPRDAGPFITMPMVFTHDPVSGKRNVGMYRLQVYDRNTLGFHAQLHKDAARDAREYETAGRRMEVAAAIGADPVAVFSAIAPLPPGIDELIFAGFARGEAVELTRAETVDILVPAHAEYVIEGYVDPGERRREGPFGDHTGFYSLADDYPVMHVTAITHRKRPIYQTTIVGRPPMEDAYMGRAVERLFLPIMKKQFPELVDMHMPYEGVFHNLMIIAIKKQFPGHARKMMHGIWGLGQAMFTKCIVVVDHDTNIQDAAEVAWKTLNHIDPQRDIEFVMGPHDVLDHSSRLPSYGSKMGIDATRKWASEGFSREWPDEILMDAEVRKRVDALWPSLGL